MLGIRKLQYARLFVQYILIVCVQILLLTPGFIMASESEKGAVSGKIQSIDHSGNSLMVAGKTLSVSEDTVLIDDEGEQVDFSIFRKGYSVSCAFLIEGETQVYSLTWMKLLSEYSSYEIPQL